MFAICINVKKYFPAVCTYYFISFCRLFYYISLVVTLFISLAHTSQTYWIGLSSYGTFQRWKWSYPGSRYGFNNFFFGYSKQLTKGKSHRGCNALYHYCYNYLMCY